jgi:hypothetical protein
MRSLLFVGCYIPSLMRFNLVVETFVVGVHFFINDSFMVFGNTFLAIIISLWLLSLPFGTLYRVRLPIITALCDL